MIVLLYLKKYWYVLLIGLAIVAYVIIYRTLPEKTIMDLGEKPSDKPPKDIVAPNFLASLQTAKKANDEKINNLSRNDLIDSINKRYR